jgi:5'-phosphate synthase pdxT subunit
VLALQGDFARHEAALAGAGAEVRRVRHAGDLEGLDGLVLPGGESTTLLRLLAETGLREPLERLAAKRPVLATCAGLILLARALTDGGRVPFPPLGLLDCEVERNAYGRQVDSFEAPLRIAGEAKPFPGVFIRAPRLRGLGKDVEPIAWHGDEVVGVRQGGVFGLAFHPELTPDARLHRRFLAACHQTAPCLRA